MVCSRDLPNYYVCFLMCVFELKGISMILFKLIIHDFCQNDPMIRNIVICYYGF